MASVLNNTVARIERQIPAEKLQEICLGCVQTECSGTCYHYKENVLRIGLRMELITQEQFSSFVKLRKNIYTYDGFTGTLLDWSVHIGVTVDTLKARMRKGMPPEKVFSSKALPRGVHRKVDIAQADAYAVDDTPDDAPEEPYTEPEKPQLLLIDQAFAAKPADADQAAAIRREALVSDMIRKMLKAEPVPHELLKAYNDLTEVSYGKA